MMKFVGEKAAQLKKNLKEGAEKFSNAKWKTMSDYEAEEKAKEPKAEKKKYAKGGSVTRADGCAKRGKTKGRMV